MLLLPHHMQPPLLHIQQQYHKSATERRRRRTYAGGRHKKREEPLCRSACLLFVVIWGWASKCSCCVLVVFQLLDVDYLFLLFSMWYCSTGVCLQGSCPCIICCLIGRERRKRHKMQDRQTQMKRKRKNFWGSFVLMDVCFFLLCGCFGFWLFSCTCIGLLAAFSRSSLSVSFVCWLPNLSNRC